MSLRRPPVMLSVLLFLVGIPLLLPFAYILLRTGEVGFHRAAELVFRERVFMLLANTLVLAGIVCVASLIIGTVSALLLERYRIFGRRFFAVAVTLPLCIPGFIASFSWLSLSFRFTGLPGSVLVMTMGSIPLVYLPVCAALRRTDRAMEEVSFSLGRTRHETFVRITLPQLKPALASGFLLIALHLLIEFGVVSILNYPTFTTAIFQEYDMAFDNASAALLSLMLVIVCILVVSAESNLRGPRHLARTGKGVISQPPLRNLSPAAHAAAVIFFLVQFALGVAIPASMVLYWVAVGTSLQSTFDAIEFLQSIGLSIGVSAIAAAITVIVALPLVWCAVRYRGVLTVCIDRLPFLLHAVPGIVIALSLTYFSIRFARPLYQSFAPVLIAYLMLFLPMAQTALRASLSLIPSQMEDIGRSLGRPNGFVFRTLVLPAILPGFAAAYSLVFLSMMKELTATLVLMPTTVRTMSVSVWEFALDGSYAAVGPYALALIVFSGIPVFLLRRFAFT